MSYKLRDGGTSKELHTAMTCGNVADHVDQVYSKLLGKIFGYDFIAYLQRQRPGIWHSMMAAFIESKLKVTSETTGNVKIEVPERFKTYFESMKEMEMGEAIKRSQIGGLKYIEPYLWVHASIIRSLFKRIISFIVRFIRGLLEIPDLANIKAIYMVGGFMESDIVRKIVFDEFQDIPVLIPNQPSQAVSMCALLLGLESEGN